MLSDFVDSWYRTLVAPETTKIMPHPRLLTEDQAVLLIVDVQESFRKHMQDFSTLTKNIVILSEASKILKLPVFVTEQYPKGLGSTVSEIADSLSGHQQFEKSCFSCCQFPPFVDALKKTGRKQIMVSGIEAHVCVNQTVHDLLHAGYTVHLITDAIASRFPHNKQVGIEKMVASGAIISSVEMALFEMLVESGTEKFKAVQKLVK